MYDTDDQTGSTVEIRPDPSTTDKKKRKHGSSTEEGRAHDEGDSEAVTVTAVAEHGDSMSITGRTVGAAVEANVHGNSDATHGEEMHGTGDIGTVRTWKKKQHRSKSKSKNMRRDQAKS